MFNFFKHSSQKVVMLVDQYLTWHTLKQTPTPHSLHHTVAWARFKTMIGGMLRTTLTATETGS